MANIPNSNPDGFKESDWTPIGTAAANVPGGVSTSRPRQVEAEGVNPAEWTPVAPAERYQPIGMDVEGLRSSLNRSLGVQPDHVADVFKISRRTGLDIGTIERNPEDARRADELARSAEGLDDFMRRNPKATAWLRDPANFGLAKDDLDTLGGVEQEFTRNSMSDIEPEEAGGVGSSALKTVKRTIPTVGMGLWDVYGLGAGGLDYIERGLGNLLGTGSTGVFGQGRDYFHGQAGAIADNILSQPGLSLPKSKQGRLWDNPRLLLDPEWLTFNVGDAANSMLPTIASLFLSGGATAVPAAVGAMQEAGSLYHQLIAEDKADPDKALSAALGFGVVVGQLEKFGLDKIMDKRVASTFAKRIAKTTVAGTSEGASEWAEEPFQAFFQGMANNESPEQVTARVAESLKNVDVIPGAFILGGAGAYGNTAHEYHKAKAAQRMGVAFDEISKLSGESKLNARLPEAYQEYVEHVRRETGGAVPEKVYVSAQRLAEAVVETGARGGDGSMQADAQVLAQFFQSIGVQPEEAQRMAALDQDVEIPFALYQSKIAPTDIGAGLANDVRFTHDGMTRNEAVEFEKEFQGRVQAELAAQEQNRAQHDTDLSQVISEYKGELARIGMKGKDADAQLQLLSSGANVAAARWSAIKGETVTPAQWLREVRGLQIRAVEQGQAQHKPDLEQGIAHAGADLSNPEQVAEAKRLWETMGTESPYFKRWFGDSKVVDGAGKPLVVYHGTSAKSIAAFDKDKTQDSLFWFTSDKAKIESGESGAAGASSILPVYLSAKKLAGWREYDRLTIDQMIAEGYDGIKLDDDYVMFSPAQIKSVFNRGTFDGSDPRILHHPINDDVDPGRRVPIISLDGVTPFELGSKGAKQFLAMWKGAPLVLDETGDGLKAKLSSRDADHAFWSSKRTGRDDSHRTTALAALDAVLRGAVLVETLEAKHGGVAHTHRFYVPVSLNGKTTTLRITTHEMEGKPRAIDGVEVYDVINEKSPASQTAAITVGNGAAGGMQGTLSVRQMLAGVKDSEGRFYFKGRIFHGEPSASRGSISFTDRGTFISLFKGAANLSTLPHEFGHLFVNDLEAMVATGRAPESVVKDLETLKGFAGDLSTTEAQEKLARAFEAYLREGKAPSAELRTSFQRFAAWLTAIYRDIRALVGPDGLSDEVRGVFDRMLASEDEIAAAEAYYGAKETLEKIATDMLTDAEKKRISELRGASHAAALEKRIKRYVAAYLKALGGKQALEAEARAEVEAQPVYAAADEAVASGGLSYADVTQELGGVALIPELNKRRPGLVRDNSTFNVQLRKKHEEALASLRKSQKKDVGEQRNFLSEMFEEGLKYNMAWRLKSYLLYGADPLGEHASSTMPDKKSKHYAATTVGLDYEDAVYHFGKQGIEGIQIGLVKRGGIKIDALMQEWGLSSADEVRDALHFNRGSLRETFVSSGLTELNQDVLEFRQNRTVGVTLPEVLALKHGFDSAEHLLMEILKSQNKGEAIKELTARKLSEKEKALRERLGEETVPGEEDIHSDEALERLATEAKALERQIYASAGAKIKVTKPVNAAASREVARAVLEGMTLADARDYRRFAAAERRAGLEVVKAVKAQKWQDALAAKQREAINHALVLESVQLRDEVNKELAFVKRVAKSKSMRFEAKEQFLSLVQAYQLGTESMVPERPGELADLSEFLKAAFEGDLFNPFDAFPDWLLQKQKAGHHRNLLTADFREVTYLMRSLADVGGSETMKMATEDKSYGQKAAECAAPIVASGQKVTKVDDATKPGQRREKFRWAMASLNFQRDTFRKADGFVDLGPANSHHLGPNQGIHERIQKATSAMLRMLQGHEKPMREVAKVRQAFAERFRQQYGELAPTLNGVEVPSALQNIGRKSWTAERVWTLARNIGNGGNRRCIIEGYGMAWEDVQKLMAVLTRDELLAIQREGEIIGAHYHEADKTFRAVYHRPMAQRIEYQPFTIQAADGPVQLNGWYFPINIDAALNPNVADRAQADILQSDPAHGAFPPNPRKSFTNARTGTALPVALSFDVFERGLSEQARFVHLAPILKDADRVFRQAEYREAYTDAFGRHAYEEIRLWLKNIATPVMEQAGAFDSVLDKGRRLSSVWILAWNLKSALKQELGLFPAMKEMGALSVLRGLKTVAPFGETTIAAINALSPRMQNRDTGIDQEQREILAKARNETMKLGFGKHKLSLKVTQHDVLQFSMSLQRLFDKHVTYSVWAGAYIKGQQELGMTQEDAIDYADRLVERTQVTNTDAAMNALQRSRGAMRVFTMFMSEALPKGSRTRVDFNALKAGRLSYAQYARSVFYEFVGPALFNAAALTMLAGAAPDEPKDYFWALWNEVLGVFPLLSGVAGAYLYGRGVGETPLFTGFELQVKAAAKAAKIPTDMENLDNWAGLFLALLDVAAFSAGVGNVRRHWQTAAEGWEDISDDETKNPLRLFLKKPKGH